jgi:NitT/TauT family transport system permease protein
MAELFATENGVGAGLAMARVNLDTAGAMAWILVVVVLLIIAEHGLLRPLQKKMEPWRQGASGTKPGP